MKVKNLWERQEFLGKGGYNVVYKVIPGYVSPKIGESLLESQEEFSFDYQKEKALIISKDPINPRNMKVRKLDNPFIVKIEEVYFSFEENGNSAYCFQVQELGAYNLSDLKKRNLMPTENEIFLFISQFSECLIYLQEKNLYHTDIKSANIVFDENFEKIMLIDLDSLCKSYCERIETLITEDCRIYISPSFKTISGWKAFKSTNSLDEEIEYTFYDFPYLVKKLFLLATLNFMSNVKDNFLEFKHGDETKRKELMEEKFIKTKRYSPELIALILSITDSKLEEVNKRVNEYLSKFDEPPRYSNVENFVKGIIKKENSDPGLYAKLKDKVVQKMEDCVPKIDYRGMAEAMGKQSSKGYTS